MAQNSSNHCFEHPDCQKGNKVLPERCNRSASVDLLGQGRGIRKGDDLQVLGAAGGEARVLDQSFDPAVPGDTEAGLLVRNLIESSTEYSIIGKDFRAVLEAAPAAMVIVTAEGKDSTSAGGCLPKAVRAL
jgi:hypothetical protein